MILNLVRSFSTQTRRSLRANLSKPTIALPHHNASPPSRDLLRGTTSDIPEQLVSKSSEVLRSLDQICSLKSLSSEDIKALKRSIAFLESNQLRSPIRDTCQRMVPLFANKAFSDGAMLEPALLLLQASGRAMLFFQELFDYCGANLNHMTSHQLSVYIYECGRHGLRCKHLMDLAMQRAVRMEFESSALSSIFKAICRNASDYNDFISRNIDEQIAISGSLSATNQLVLFRIVKQIKDGTRFRTLLNNIDITNYTIIEKFNLIYQMKKSKDFENFPARAAMHMIQSVVNDLQSSLSTTADLISAGVIVTDITDALDAMASLRVRRDDVIQIWMDFLVDKIAEIKYSPICGLWQAVTDSLGHLRFFHAPWMKRAVDEMASNSFALKSFAAFQLVFFTSSLGRLNYYSEKVYKTITNVLKDDVKSINDVDMLATLLFPIERAGFSKCSELLSRILDQTLVIQKSQRRRPDDRNTIRGSLGVVYSCLSLDEKFAGDPRLMSIMHHVRDHMQPKLLHDSDYQRLFRVNSVLESYGVRGIDLPPWVREKDSFAWNNYAHSNQVKRISETSGFKMSHIPLVDLEKDDGTLVIVEDRSEHMMKWLDEKNDRDMTLVSLGTSGSTELRKRILTKGGFSKVEVICF